MKSNLSPRLTRCQYELAALLAFCLCLALPAAKADNIPDLLLRAGQSLDGEWKTIIDPFDSGFFDYRSVQRDLGRNPSRGETFYLDSKPANPGERIEYDFDTSPSLRVPGDWNTQRPELLYYEGSVWYRKKFEVTGLASGERVFLRFGAANYRADVYLNGQKLGTHIGGFTPFSFEVTSRVLDGINSLVVRVNNQRARENVPTLNTDWWNYGGLTRSVKLVRTPAVLVADHRIWLESENTMSIAGSVQLLGAQGDETVEVSIAELDLRVRAKTDKNGYVEFRMSASKLQLWSPVNPKLYEVTVRCGEDQVTEPVGFRTIRTKGKQLLLNGQPVFLRGICMHEEYPLQNGGRVRDASQAEQLLLWAKELNCNFVRLAHYPHNEDMTRLADKLGIMVWSEIPVYWTIDWMNPATFANAEQQLTDEIRRDSNRASIIIWSMANETPVSHARTEFLVKLAAKARQLDSTRLISAAMERHAKTGDENVSVVQDPLVEAVDVVAFNEYVGWYVGLPDMCSKVSWEIPYNKPVFVSEWGGDARQGYHGEKSQRWTEEFQEDLYLKTLPMLDKIDGLVGFSPWLLTDFRSPKRVLPGIQDGYNRKGLISSEGVRKKAFSVLQEYYRKRALAEELKR